MELKKVQKDIWQNKLNKGFNTTDVNKEFCLLYGEVSEAYDAWRKKKDDLNEEIYLMGLSEMLNLRHLIILISSLNMAVLMGQNKPINQIQKVSLIMQKLIKKQV